ncbi:hypothetical protein GCM10010349_27510 [Streptomyces flavofungini]|nr:hypothetical protein GCM10010349_27510 [Streptomyces flavofungini]
MLHGGATAGTKKGPPPGSRGAGPFLVPATGSHPVPVPATGSHPGPAPAASRRHHNYPHLPAVNSGIRNTAGSRSRPGTHPGGTLSCAAPPT